MNTTRRVAVVATTINSPYWAEQWLGQIRHYYRGPDEPSRRLFVVGDLKTPHDEYKDLERKEVKWMRYINPDMQEYSKWECKKYLDWNTVPRRNLGILEALDWGADYLITVDDDILSLTPSSIEAFVDRLEQPYNGLTITRNGMFNPGLLYYPEFRARGYPANEEWQYHLRLEHSCNARIGVVCGLNLGDPDVDASFRLEYKPRIMCSNEVGQAGVAIDPRITLAPIFSQYTAFVRELAHCMAVWPAVGRYDDILGGYYAQTEMAKLGYWTFFGKPFGYQNRNVHNVVKDLALEMEGMVGLTEGTIKVPKQARDFLRAWYRDVRSI